MDVNNYHVSILGKEITCLAPKEGLMFDATLGGGGHSKMLFDNLINGKLISVDRDQNSIYYCANKYGCEIEDKENDLYVLKDKNKEWVIIKSEFSHINDLLEKLVPDQKLNFFLADIGVSSHQIDEKKRGFSFMENGPLDMRMNKSQELSAKDLVNGLPQKELEQIFREYGEEKYSQLISQMIAKRRSQRMLTTTFDIVEIIKESVGNKYEAAKHPARRVFQALRIAVNNELGELESLCRDLPGLMHDHGIIVILTFHSLERNIIEKYFPNYEKLIPSIEEIKYNSRAKSTVGYVIRL